MNTNWNDPNFQGFGRQPRPKRERHAVGTPVGRTLLNIAVTLVFAAVYFYVVLPPISLKSENFYIFVLLVCAVYGGCAILTSGFQGTGMKGYFGFLKKQCTVPLVIAAALVVTALVGAGLTALSLLLVPTLFVPVVFPLFKLYGESAAIATALAVTGFLSIPLHAYSISAVTGVLRAGGDVFWSTLLDVGPQWCMALPLTALLALVLKADYWWIAAAIQSESLLKVPLCALRIRTGQWIHDVTVRKERGQ